MKTNLGSWCPFPVRDTCGTEKTNWEQIKEPYKKFIVYGSLYNNVEKEGDGPAIINI